MNVTPQLWRLEDQQDLIALVSHEEEADYSRGP